MPTTRAGEDPELTFGLATRGTVTRALPGQRRGSRERGRKGLEPAAGDRAFEELRNGVMPWAGGKGPKEVILFVVVKMREIKTCL